MDAEKEHNRDIFLTCHVLKYQKLDKTGNKIDIQPK